MLIDLDTTNNLELVKSSLDGKPKNSLYGVMNRTHTQMAARLLRSTILQPVIVKDILENRLSVVEELVENDALRKTLKTVLTTIDKFSQELKFNDAHAVERRIDDLLSLRRLMASIRMFANALQGAESGLLQTAHNQNYKAIKLYAIIAEPNGTLDIARKTHTEHVEDIAKRTCFLELLYLTKIKKRLF
ncbi:hypothetical protein QFC22_000749 [Naganishia vaughanmartiniae]|uniref:Uncharacterized protein n=1 Tax=Naganishia vaughanmartiniae TaxID=1424756 RepID=A0ACC2XJD1_9TREE|nr:hypothetical protein QFC22_000749 [Naganishia vaughanmartiniae]